MEEKFSNEFQSWVEKIVKEFRKNGDKHPVTVGGEVSLKLLNVLDYGSIHTYHPGKFSFLNKKYSKPVIFQGVWNTAGCGLKEVKQQAEQLKKNFMQAFQKGAQGFVPWQWTRQARLWNHMYETER